MTTGEQTVLAARAAEHAIAPAADRAPEHGADRSADQAADQAADTRIIRPAAVLGTRAAAEVVRNLQRLDVSRGGTWNASSSLWQRYDRPWDGPGGTRGGAQLVGSIAVVYDSPTRHSITIYKVTVSSHGLDSGWSVESLCDDALGWAALSLATCPRAELAQPPSRDPFHRRTA